MSEYDENGFDEDWVHIVTGTRYDEYGFNKNRSIHKDTGLPVDTNGQRRNNYPNSIFSLPKKEICFDKEILDKKVICFDKEIQNLFFYHDDLYILKKLLTDSPIIDQKRAKYKKPIRLIDYKQTSNQVYIGPKCIDGSPDMRYNVHYTTEYHTIFTINIEKTDIKKTFNKYFTEKKIQEAINNYNFYLIAIQDIQLGKLYNILIDINSKCVENKKLSIQLMTDIKENIIIYKKLEKHQKKFSKEQQDKFSNLGENIKIIESKIKDIDSFDEKFEEVHQNFIIRFNEIKEASADNEVDELFAQIK